MTRTVSLITLAMVMMCAMEHTASQDPWALMGVTCIPETVPVTIINNSGCRKEGVRVQFCRGTCRSASQFQIEFPYYRPICRCCKKTETYRRPVLLTCPDGSFRIKYISYASKCACQNCNL